MTALITKDDVNVWLDSVKTNVATLEDGLADQITSTVLGAISQRYSVEGWLDPTTTPLLVKRIISMFYAGYFYHRTFSNDSEPGVYGDKLLADAQTLLDGVVAGTTVIPTSSSIPVVSVDPNPTFASELLLTDPVFSMDKVF